MVDRYYQKGRPIHFVGSGNQTRLVDPTVESVALCNEICAPIERVAADAIRVTTGWRWLDLLHYLQSEGLTFPVFTSNLNATIGGTLATGGVGLLSHRSGLQVDHVLACTIHSAAGKFTLHPCAEPLWQSALCSLGGVGFVSSVILKVEQPEAVFILDEAHIARSDAFQLFMDCINNPQPETAFVICRVDRRSAAVRIGSTSQASKRGQTWTRSLTTPETLALSSTSEVSGHTRRLWNDFILSIPEAPRFFEATMTALAIAEREVGISARVRALSLAAPPSGTDRPFLHPLSRFTSASVGIGFYLDVDPTATGALATALELQQRLKGGCIARGGAPYAAGTLKFSAADCPLFYGQGWDQFSATRTLHDPLSLFGTALAFPFRNGELNRPDLDGSRAS